MSDDAPISPPPASDPLIHPTRTNTISRKVETAFGSMYIHVEVDAAFRPVGGSISDPGKEPQSQIAGLVEDLSRGLDDLFKDVEA